MARLGTGRVTGPNNHAGDLAPLTSPYGQAWNGAVGGWMAKTNAIGRQNKGNFARDGEVGTLGGFTSLNASVLALSAEERAYWGDLPQSQQPIVDEPAAWERGGSVTGE